MRGETYWSDPEWYSDLDDIDFVEESRIRVGRVLKAEGDSVRYDYDFGDNWRHEIVLEKMLPAVDVRPAPLCLGGERHRLPEDVGGTSGYERFLEVIFDPTHEEHEHYMSWVGGSLQPEEFNLDAINETLARMRWPMRHRR